LKLEAGCRGPGFMTLLNAPWLSTLLAALPIVVLLGGLAFLKLKAHVAVLSGLMVSVLISILVFRMPADKTFLSTGFGAAYGRFSHRLDNLERYLSLRALPGPGSHPGAAGKHGQRDIRPAPAATFDSFLFRRFF